MVSVPSLEFDGFEEVTLPDVEEEEEQSKVAAPQRSKRRKDAGHGPDKVRTSACCGGLSCSRGPSWRCAVCRMLIGRMVGRSVLVLVMTGVQSSG